ncbi:uncharacterized protein SCHCODRAFT_02505034 [Schizophyllum commune H4-8]|uniref:C2H2-type domain-containing protein n=1 Tax=Schizophyllum commune (strain H4-8 / FGSC 9210) TaxID=578458 RepID=D8Q6J8_SCHCM|nr:uncharacterized protein SCHCODRAFT_02505034 [Schizophyllum commune H4-8]KAI5890909.1 hypothetical protein SCHCODRAFT_02505034 [Schizophyllum commune H4-8]
MGIYAKPHTTRKASVTRKACAPQKPRVRKTELALFMSRDELPGFRDGLHCDSCGRRALSSTSKIQHKRLHYADDAPGADLFKRPHRCDWCGKDFPQKGSLTRHIASQHDKSLMAPCSKCDQRFSDRARLHRHRVSEHGHVPKKRRKDDRKIDEESHAEREEDADSEEGRHEDAARDWDSDADGDMDAEGDVDDEVALAGNQSSSSLMPQRCSLTVPMNDDLERLSAPPIDFQVIDTAPVDHLPAPAQYALGSAIFASVDTPNFAAQYHPDTIFSNPFMPGFNNASLPTLHEALDPGDDWTLPQSRMHPSSATNLNTDLPSSANFSTLTSTPLASPPLPQFPPFVDPNQLAWDVGLGESTALGDFAAAAFDDLDLPALDGFHAYTADEHGSSWD